MAITKNKEAIKTLRVFPLIIVIVVALSGCEEFLGYTTEYEVICDPEGFNVAYIDGRGQLKEEEVPRGELRIPFLAKRGDIVTITAAAHSLDAKVTVRIYYRGKMVDQATNTGDYAVATAAKEL